ncbi:MAG: pentapeptide repeat-containing protein [Desulfobaccales bacterium]
MVGARLEKVGQVWRRVKPCILGFLVVLVAAGAVWALIYVPKMQVPVCPPGKDGLPPKICFDIENEARKTLAYIMAGVLAIIGIYMGFRRIRASENQVRSLEQQVVVAQEGQITERFTRAIEQLGSDRMEIRLGGIYALERIANDSDKDYWTIMETLTAYVRERVPWREQAQDEKGKTSGEEPVVQEALTPEAPTAAGAAEEQNATAATAITPAPAAPKPATDIQAILTVLGRRKYRYRQKEEKGRLDLRNTDLRGADLTVAHLEGANLVKAHLEDADLQEAHLEGADLTVAHLEGANLWKTHLEGANLWFAHLEGADLWEAHLEGADLKVGFLEGTDLLETHLEGADLRGAMGLTPEQLAQAIIDEKTILPDYLQEETQEGKGPEGGQEE